MRRENHRRRGVSRASAGGFGHRAVYIGAAVATAALLAGFGAAILVYGPLGTPTHQIGGTTLNVPPAGVTFGNASLAFAAGLNLLNATGGGWNWSENSTGFYGPCSHSGIYLPNGSYAASNNASSAVNLTGNTTLVCLNSVTNGTLNATWYYAANGSQQVFNTYNATGYVPNGSYFTDSQGNNITACDNWTLFHTIIQGGAYNQSYLPCDTYFEMNNNTNWLPAFNATGNSSLTLWSPMQNGYLPNDLVYAIPVYFSNLTKGGVYEVSVAIEGVTPVAQTFFFNFTGKGTNNTVLFTFDMTAAWLMDLGVTNQTPFNSTSMAIYGSIGTVSGIVSECGAANGVAVCPIVTRQ